MSKKVLGLDLGTNSIGWALVEQDFDEKYGRILEIGSRIIPMAQDILSDFDKGNTVSQTATRTKYRGVRRLLERNLLRRERLHRVLNTLGFLPDHFSEKIDKYGKFSGDIEIKLPYSEFNINTKKWDFIFKSSFEEMVLDFRKSSPQLFFIKKNGEESKIPYDWTIYYLRKKALKDKIEKQELAWILLHFNQKRGYYQLRGEDEIINENKKEEFHCLKVVEVTAGEKGKKENEIWYNVVLENGWIYRRTSQYPIYDWVGKNRDFIVTTELNDDNSTKTDKEGKEKRSFRSPKEDDWNLIKKKTENDLTNYLAQSKLHTVGFYIYENLLLNPALKIKGKFIRTIERNFYKEELEKILETQIKFHPELNDDEYYKDCCDALYEQNDIHKKNISNQGFKYLFVDDIIFYQRPLKSKKSEISDCPFESRKYIQNGEEKSNTLKCIPRSHPLFQEFRLWQWISNVRIYQRSSPFDIDVTETLLSSELQLESLFEFLIGRKDIDQNTLLKYLLEPQKLKGKVLNDAVANYRWNYIDDKEKTYPCNETHSLIANRLSKVENASNHFLTQDNEIKLWHILYSVRDKNEIIKALKTYISKYNRNYKTNINEDQFVENFKRYPLIKSEYGSFSEKAIKKLLPLMRLGKYWVENHIIENMDLYQKSKNAVIDKINLRENTKSEIKEKLLSLGDDINGYKGLRKEIATYLVYQIHSENSDTSKWNTPNELDLYLKQFKQHSLRNPIVEQVITETLRVVKDIWVQYGESAKEFFDEIHIELGREMKNNAADRKAITENNLQNENTNLRIRAMMTEFATYTSDVEKVDKINPQSPYQQEAFKIFEDGVLKSGIELPEDVVKITKSSSPSRNEILRYRLWLEQKYRSPYTGQVIPLSKLFTTEYQIEHIIPQSIYYDDSFSNKVICESVVNAKPYKDNQFGLEFIKNQGSTIVTELSTSGRTVKIFNEDEYRKFIETHYASNKAKSKKLLLEEVPDKMIERQLNDTRYISKVVKNLLSKIVREGKDDEGYTSKNVLATNGTITNTLKHDWGINDLWNDLMLPRFVRLNQLTNSNNFTYYNSSHHKFLPTVPENLRKGFQLKRIDHRHHAMDAVVIACTTRNHINYLNNSAGLDKDKKERQNAREDLKRVLCFKTKPDASGNYKWQFYKPWETITQDTKAYLEKVVVSFKQNLRVINKTVNYYQKFVDCKKALVKQSKGENWAIRKPLHKETVYGKVEIKVDLAKIISLNNAIDNWHLIINPEIKNRIKLKIKESNNDLKIVKKYFKENPIVIDEKTIDRVCVYEWVSGTASRVALDESFDENKIKTRLTDSALEKILLNHIKKYNNKIDDKGNEIAPHLLAFSPEGIEEMNKNILALNEGKKHQPIFKVRIYEAGNKFAVGYQGNKKDKFVEAAKGTNLYFAIYTNESGKRTYETIPLNIVIERLKQGLSPVPEKENNTVFWLSPNDLVYIPSDDESENISNINFNNLKKDQVGAIYKFVSCTSGEGHFVPVSYSKDILKNEMGTNNKSERPINLNGFDKTKMIKEKCIKLQVDRLGNIKLYQPKYKQQYLKTQNTDQRIIISEPTSIYQTKPKLTFYKDFNDMENSRIDYVLQTHAVTRIKNTVELIKRIFGEEKCSSGISPKKLYFK